MVTGKMWLRTKWLVLWSMWAARLVQQPTAPVRVSNGWLRGTISPDGSHARYLGIPYASVKTEDRFQNPKPEPKWDGVFEADNENIRCVQRFTNSRVLGREDCLTLNVYTPLYKTGQLLPVMVFIHGGGFRDGSGSPFLYGPEYLVKHGVLLVTFNYRLEILGFLCLGIKEAPGNAGLKDQVKAFRWVQRNIKAFGGDPDNVTIFGESAGSASVLYHLLSPMSTGLFQKAIMQSGSALSPWSLQFEPLKTASKLAQRMGYSTEDPYEIYKMFTNITADELLKARVPRPEGDIVLSENIFVPCIENNIQDTEQFLLESPYNLLSKGHYNKVPIIIGYNNAEGYMFAGKENETMISNFNFYKALPRDLIFPSTQERGEVAKTLKHLYMGNKNVSKESLLEFSGFEGDSSIIFPVISTTDLLLKTTNKSVYVYRISYDGWLNLAKMLFGFWRYSGATHADELFYMFKIKVTLAMTFFEAEFIDKITAMWTNFAKYEDPTPAVTLPLHAKWEPADKKNPYIFEINRQCSIAPLWEDEVIRFWNTTYSKYRRKN